MVFSEIVEFALSIAAPAKGQESFPGLPHLQAYKLLRAMSLAEVGQMQLASRSAHRLHPLRVNAHEGISDIARPSTRP
jgi:hypothetical protein